MIKKRRRYYYPSPLAIDKFNTQVLKALSVKLTRDYGEFFKNLSELYTKGAMKKRLMSTTSIVDKSISILNSMISSANVSKDEVEILMSNIDEINTDRDFYVEQSKENASLHKKIQKVEETTGVATSDLNVTRDIIKKGAAQTKRRTREGAIPFLQRTAPGAMSLGAELGRGALGALGGPFAPIAEMAGTMVKGAYGVGKGVREKIASHREQSLSGKLAPMVRRMPSSAFEQIAGARKQGQSINKFGGISRRSATQRKRSKEELVMPLQYFFDKKAHKAKWTKEMSSRFKAIEKAIRRMKGGKGADGLFGSLTKGITPLLAKFGLLTAGIAAATLSIYKIKKAGDVIGKFIGAKKGLKESKAAMKAAAGPDSAWEKHLLSQEDPLASLQSAKMKGQLAPQMAQQLEKRMTPEYIGAHKTAVKATSQTAQAKSLTQKLRGNDNDNLLEDMPQRIRDPFAKRDDEFKNGLKDVVKAVKEVGATISRQQSSGVKGASLGDPFGVGSPFTMGLSNGELTVGED